jgi:hypothetical protein
MSIVSWIILGLIAGFAGAKMVLLIYNAVMGHRRA